MKKLLALMVIFLVVVKVGFALDLNIERLTFTESRPDGTIIGTVTVDAIFAGFVQQNIAMEGNLQVIRERQFINVDVGGDGQWSDWEVTRRFPPIEPILQLYFRLLREWSMNPRIAARIHFSVFQAVRIATIPDGRSSPFWWSNDGRSFYTLTELWVIAP